MQGPTQFMIGFSPEGDFKSLPMPEEKMPPGLSKQYDAIFVFGASEGGANLPGFEEAMTFISNYVGGLTPENLRRVLNKIGLDGLKQLDGAPDSLKALTSWHRAE